MVALAIAPYPAFRLTDFEVARGGTTYTIETLRHLKARLPRTEVLLVIGSDSLATFETCRAWREILAAHRLAIVTREGFSRAEVEPRLSPDLLAAQAPHGATLDDAPEEARVFWGGNAPVTISSTWIRRAVPAGEKLPGVPPPVEQYIRRQRLYLAP
jgi:nicotinate-nucleotide adenylyltransferase